MIEKNYFIERLEQEIIDSFNGKNLRDYTREEALLKLRKDVLNQVALQHQQELLPIIVEFNDALKNALHELYQRALRVWVSLDKSKEMGECSLTAKCYLDNKYPERHPIQNKNRQELWDALCDTGWNRLYSDGVNCGIHFRNPHIHSTWMEEMGFSIGSDAESDNWNEGLDKELTKDLHLIYPFHHLFDHTMFALTDFIYIRKFETEIIVEINKHTHHQQ